MKRNKFFLALFIFFLFVGFQLFSGCFHFLAFIGFPLEVGAGPVDARSYLIANEIEKDSYGLFSYILFSQKPEKKDSIKYSELINIYLKKIPELKYIDDYENDSNINIIYFPVIKSPIHYLRNYSDDQKIEWLIENHDYGRSSVYLNKFEFDLSKGPYIISFNRPLSKVDLIREKYLLQDFSNVHPKVVSLWVDEFLKQSSETIYWNEEHLKNFSNDLRNAIAFSAEGLQEVGESLQWWEDRLKGWITLR